MISLSDCSLLTPNTSIPLVSGGVCSFVTMSSGQILLSHIVQLLMCTNCFYLTGQLTIIFELAIALLSIFSFHNQVYTFTVLCCTEPAWLGQVSPVCYASSLEDYLFTLEKSSVPYRTQLLMY